MVSEERRKIQENIDRLSHDIQKEEEEQEKKKQLFVEDLDHQVAEKKADPTKRNINDKSQRIFLGRKPFVETNELANKLNFQLNLDEPVISVSITLHVKAFSILVCICHNIFTFYCRISVGKR